MDILVVGCGLAGAVIARELAEKGKKVTIWERRNHIAGNMYDYVDSHGILVHKYGPHTFHTNQKELYEYICRFAKWESFKLTCGAEINGKFTPTPFNFKTIDEFYNECDAKILKEHIKKVYLDTKSATVVEVLESDDPIIQAYAQFLFDNDYSLYTAKQWGIPATEIDPSVLKRVPLRFDYREGYFDDKYQVMPKESYVNFFEKMLNHPNISVKLNVDANQFISISSENKLLLDGKVFDKQLVYTGAIDELFGQRYGQLPYRSLNFEWKFENIESKQPMPVVAYPQSEGYTRIVEYKKLPLQEVVGTSYAIEYPIPYKSGEVFEPYYPVLTEDSEKLYEKYLQDAKKIDNLYLCGRLADFKYYNMDQVLQRALIIAKNVK